MVRAAIVHYNRAVELERTGRYEQAVTEYQEAVRLDPSDADAHVHLGLLLRELRRDEDANRAFEAALALYAPRSPARGGRLCLSANIQA